MTKTFALIFTFFSITETPVEACVYVSESSENRISDDHGTDLPSFDVDELIKEQVCKKFIMEFCKAPWQITAVLNKPEKCYTLMRLKPELP